MQWCSGAFQTAVDVRCAVGVLAQWCNGALVQWCISTFQIAVRVRCAVDALVQCCFGAYVGALMQWFVCLSVWRSVALSVGRCLEVGSRSIGSKSCSLAGVRGLVYNHFGTFKKCEIRNTPDSGDTSFDSLPPGPIQTGLAKKCSPNVPQTALAEGF